MDPLMPSVLDGTLALACALAASFAVAGFVSLIRTHTKPHQFFGWALIIFLIPFAGSVIWFVHRSRTHHSVEG